MSRDWLAIRVELTHGRGIDLDPPPGRVFLVAPRHTFGYLAEAIDLAFARWDLGHLHVFELEDGRRIGPPDPELEFEDETVVKVASHVRPGSRFRYVFDFGDDWTHDCSVEDLVGPLEAYGEEPLRPVPIFGWGSIPDQYGRTSADGEE